MTDQRFQDFPQKPNPDGADELVGVDGASYIRVPVASLNTGVNSVNGDAGPDVVLNTSDISDSPNRKYTTATDVTRLANTEGTNTGDDAGYRTVQQAGSAPVTREDTLEFAGSGVAVTAGSNKTTVTFSGGSGPSSTAGYIDRVLEPGAPIFLCGVGQSLMTPYPADLSAWVPSYPTLDSPTPLPNIANQPNSAIKEFCSDGLGGGGPYPGDTFANGTSTGYGDGNGAPQNFAWRMLDINKPGIADRTGMSITGYTGLGATNELHAMAVKLHEWTGRDVYIFMNHYSGHGLVENYWPFQVPDSLTATITDPAGTQPDIVVNKGGMGYNKFVTDFDDAVAQGQAADPLFPDTPTFFFWCSGGSDGLGGEDAYDPMQWLEYYLDLDRELERAGRIEPSTPRLFWDYAENQDPVFQWGCYRVAAEYLQRPVNILQRTYETWDGTHPLGDRQFHDGTIQAQKLINFSDEKNLDGGSKLQRNTEDVVTYGEWLQPTNNPPTTLSTGQLGTNVGETSLRLPYKLLTFPSGPQVEILTHCEQFLVSNQTIALTEVDINGVIQTTPRTVTRPDGTTYVVDDPNRQTYQLIGPGEWAGNVPTDSAGPPNHIVFPVNSVQSFGTWPPANFAKVKVEYRQTFPSLGDTGYGIKPGLLGTKEYPSTPSGGIRTHVDTLFEKRVVVKTATDVPIMAVSFVDDFPGATPVFPPQENGDYERYITVSSLPQYDSTTGLLLPARQANAGRYRVEARFDVDGLLPSGFAGYVLPLVLAPQLGFRALVSCQATFTGRRISPTPEVDDIYQVQRASLINFSGIENQPFWDTTTTPPSGVAQETKGGSAPNFNEINPQGVSWTTFAHSLDTSSSFAGNVSNLYGRLWAIGPPSIAEERWRWKIVMDFTFDEYIG